MGKIVCYCHDCSSSWSRIWVGKGDGIVGNGSSSKTLESATAHKSTYKAKSQKQSMLTRNCRWKALREELTAVTGAFRRCRQDEKA